MNRGSVPGFYFDEVKKKYFKIQANHLVPEGTKYAKGNVKREKRSSKKRRVEDEKRARRTKNTIQQPPVLKSAAISGIGLEREIGSYPSPLHHIVRREDALIAQWTPEWTEIKLPGSSRDTRVNDAHYIPHEERMIVATTHAHNGLSAFYDCNWERRAILENGFVETPRQGLAAFNSSISTISTNACARIPRVLACAEQHQVGNVYMGLLSDNEEDETSPVGIYLTIGSPGTSISQSSIHSATGIAALIGSGGMFILNRDANVVNSRPKPAVNNWPTCQPCINWLDTNTVVYGAKYHQKQSVMLWDVRTPDGKAPRFSVRGNRLTGVFNPLTYGQSGLGDEHQVLASTNHQIHLFDTRMPSSRMQDTPMLSFEHIHGGPKLQSAGYGQTVAAVDAENVVQLYSLRTGVKLASLTAPEWKPRRLESPILRQLMWYDDITTGPTLQAVRGNGVVRWTWGGPDDEDD